MQARREARKVAAVELLDPTFLRAIGHPVRVQALVLFEERAATTRELLGLSG